MVTEVPGYVLRGRIGTGPRAVVWQGEAVGVPGRILAIKVVPHRDDAAIDALRREGEILAALSHPSILQVMAMVPTDGGLALITPYAAGGSLAAAVAHRPGGLPAAAVADLGIRMASALATMHGAGIVHRNVKPANILFDREHRPLLADAGIAQLHSGAPTVAGTAAYQDPDLDAGQEPGDRGDLYALGVTLYQALAGVAAGAGASSSPILTAADRGQVVPPPWHIDAPAELLSTLASAFARDPEARPASAHEFAERLDAVRRTTGLQDSDPAPVPISASGRAGVLGAVAHPADTDARSRPAGPSAGAIRPGAVTRDPSAADPVVDETGRRFRVPLLTAVLAVVLVPVAVVAVSTTGGGSPPTVALSPDDADGTDGTIEAPERDAVDLDAPGPAPSGDAAREPAPACGGRQAADDGREILLADLAGRGCSALVAWDGRRLEVFDAGAPSERYDLGAQPDDVLLFGDWTCDGRDAPALYRPADGRLFTFEQLVDAGGRASVTGTPTGVTGGTPRVMTDAAGCDRVEVGT